MNKQTIIFFLGGAAAGAFVTWLIEEARLRDLDRAWEDAYGELYDYWNGEGEFTMPEEEAEEGDNVIQMTATTGTRTKANRKAADYTRYDKQYDGDYNEDADPNEALAEHEHPRDDDEEPSDVIEMTPEEVVAAVTGDENYVEGEQLYERKEAVRVKGPTLITFESFTEDFPEFDKDELYYYTINDVLATDTDEVVDNELYVVGDCLDKFDFRHNHEDIIYVRNAGMSTDYEIHKVRGAFNPPEETWG